MRCFKICSSASDMVPFNLRTNGTVCCISGSTCHDPGRGESRLRAKGSRSPCLLASRGALGGPPLSEWSPALLTLALDRPSHARLFTLRCQCATVPGSSRPTDPGRACSVCAVSCRPRAISPFGERKEGMMIRELAQIVFHQVRTNAGRPLDEGSRPPALGPIIGQSKSAALTPVQAEAEAWEKAEGEAERGLQEQTLALVVLFTQLAQRRVQAARAQEDVHEYGSHHHDPPRTNG